MVAKRKTHYEESGRNYVLTPRAAAESMKSGVAMFVCLSARVPGNLQTRDLKQSRDSEHSFNNTTRNNTLSRLQLR